MHTFHSLGEAFWRFAPLKILNRRNHRKLTVIDDRVAYFGGMNIVDPRNGGDDRRRLGSGLGSEEKDSWRDLHVRLTGPQQAEVAESFERSWRRAHRRKVASAPDSAIARACWRRARKRCNSSIAAQAGVTRTSVGSTASSFRQARRRIDIAMAYFLPVLGVMRSLLAARRRGVRVRVIVPGVSDVPVVQHATRYLYYRLLRRRFRIYERQFNMLHSKLVVVDDEWSVIGSANLDPRSLLINYEFMAVVHSRPLALALREIIEYEIARSRRITFRQYRRLSCEQRLLDRLAWMVRWWL